VPDRFEQTVYDYLVAHRCLFISPQYWFTLDGGRTSMKGRNWYIDALAVSPKDQTCFLCEVTTSKEFNALKKKLLEWASKWQDVCTAIDKTSHVAQFEKKLWLFVPEDRIEALSSVVATFPAPHQITPLGSGLITSSRL
jgi:hypothetical protein